MHSATQEIDKREQMSKIVFLDIDGTLVDFHQTMPASAKKALEMAKANGHYLVLCTGRIYSGIYDWLLDFGFDGVVASAGAHIMWNNEEIFHSYIPKKELRNLSTILTKHNASFVFQGLNGRFMDEKNKEMMNAYFKSIGLNHDVGIFKLTICDEPYDRDDIESGMYNHADVDISQIQKEIGDGIQITGASFGDDRLHNGEFTKKGITKATGIQAILDHIGMQREDVIAFGDGPNDFEMIEYANIGVAMGNAVDELKDISDMVTADILCDGIYKGFEKLELI